ncbi:MAG TPA: glycosyltransferase [Bryobacteraceae bacterium]|nr:glycosyltransferase [Bryobacteraceae bacterium]
MASIVIPIYNALEYARECLDSVYRAAPRMPFQTIAVNNGSAAEVAEWLAAEQLRRRHLQVLTFDRPLGFAKAVNEGARQARFDRLVVLNSDSVLTGGCLDALAKVMDDDPRIGVASPVTNHSGPGAQLVSAPPPAGADSPIYEAQRLFFYCAMIRKEVWAELSGLDEIYHVGTFEDDDFCLRARMAGWSLAVVPSAFVGNHDSRTFRENHIDRDACMRRNREIFFDRASRLARASGGAPRFQREVSSLTVVVTVPGGESGGLLDSLRSLANQTVKGFDTIVVAGDTATLPAVPDDLAKALHLSIRPSGELPGTAQSEFVSYLPAGDVYYPFHLEVLYDALRERSAAAASTECRVAAESPVRWMHRRTGSGTLTLARVTCEQSPAATARGRTGDRARQLLMRSLAGRSAAGAAPAASGKPDVLLFNIVSWDALTQRPHHFVKGLAERGYRVFWIDTTLVSPGRFLQGAAPRKLAENLFYMQLPGIDGGIYHLEWNAAMLELMSSAMDGLRGVEGIGRAVQVVNFPGWAPLTGLLRQRFGWPILYDCLDDQQAFGELYGQRTTAKYEDELTRTCDLLVTSGERLFELKRDRHPGTLLIPNAANYSLFSAAVSGGLLDGLARPIVGFFGAFADWLDIAWIAAAARRFASWSFVYIGSDGFARRENRDLWLAATSAANVHVLPRAEPARLAAYLAQFDICTMPFLDLAITRSMDAVKIYEYLAAGKHVLAPALPEMRKFAARGLLFSYDSHEESFKLLEALATRAPAKEQIDARQTFAASHTWNHRLDQLTAAIESLTKRNGDPESAA